MLVTFRAKRRYSDIAIGTDETPQIETVNGFRPVNVDDGKDWKRYISQRIHEATKRGRKNILSNEREYRNFIYLCSKVGVSMFYAAPVAAYKPLVCNSDEGAGQFLLSRLEVSIRNGDDDHESRSIAGMLGWLASSGWALDPYHTPAGYDSQESMAILILVPDVVVPAHEAVAFGRDKVGEEVEDALRQLITELRKRQP